jgi:hypothetical protein
MRSNDERYGRPTRRDFLKLAGGVAGAAVAGPVAYAHHHPRPRYDSIPFLDQRMYLNNMEIIAHMPGPGPHGAGRSGGCMMMTASGGQRLLCQGNFVTDVTDPRNPKNINTKAAGGQLAYNKDLKKWIMMQASQEPSYTEVNGSDVAMGKYGPKATEYLKKTKEWNGLRGIRMWDFTDPENVKQISEYSTGKTGSGVHGDSTFYDGGKYAYLDAAADDTFTGHVYQTLWKGHHLMIVDLSDPSNVKPVSMWWVPGQRAGVPGETQMLKKWKMLEGRGAEKIPDKTITMEEEADTFRNLKFPSYDQFPFSMSHLPFYVPKRPEDGGTIGYGTWGAFGFLIHDISDIKNPKLLGRFDPVPTYGWTGAISFHSAWLGMLDRGFVITNPESMNPDCNEPYPPCWVIDVRDPKNPIPISMLPRPKPPADARYNDFCQARGRAAAHLCPALTAPGRPSQYLHFLAMFNMGLQMFDLSDPSSPKIAGYFVPPHGGELSPECIAPDTSEGKLFPGSDIEYDPNNPTYVHCMDQASSYNRPSDSCFIEWDRNIIYAGCNTGLYILTSPLLGKPVLGAMPVREWSLPQLNVGAPT